MCKSSSLVFVLGFAFAFKLEKVTLPLVLVLGGLCLGVFLMVYKDDNSFNYVGFAQVMGAVVFGGLRWSLFKLLLSKKNSVLRHPACSLVSLAPIMFLAMILLSLVVEQFPQMFAEARFFGNVFIAMQTIGIILLGSVMAYVMIMTEFYLLKVAGILTITVLGILKEVLTIVISKALFQDNEPLSSMNIIGLAVTMAGILAYNLLSYKQSKPSKAKALNYSEIASSDVFVVGSDEEVGAEHLTPDLVEETIELQETSTAK